MINRASFVKPIPKLHPKSEEYKIFWRAEKKSIIEGTWRDGYYCPPVLYFYLNFATIMIKSGKSAKSQSLSRPFNMDYVWELGYLWTEARGFSGFSGDTKYTCHKAVLEQLTDEEIKDIYCTVRDSENNLVIDEDLYNNIFKEDGTRKEYVLARDYIKRRHHSDLGYPLYGNDAKNLVYMTARGSGKSFWGANVAAHEMLTDGQKKYNPKTLIKEKAEILIGAHDAKYSSDLCTKIKLTLDNLPGAVEINGVYYPCPISKTLSGSWGPSKNVEHYYKKKIGGTWVWTGSRSVIKHRTYRDNPFAAQGGRNTVKIADEIGVWDNLIESHYADEYTQKIGNQKFGSTLYQGTGGDLTGGGSISAQKMFFDPDAYDCLTFNDEWEKKGNIGLFIPATYSKIEYKDKDGNTNFELANLSEEKEREKKKKAKDPGALDEYIVYNPIKPSEIFLQSSQNIFPVQEMARTLARLEHAARTEWIGDLIQKEDGTIDWKHNADLRPIYDFPLTKRENEEGCVVIYNPPFESADGTVPHGRYIAGMDPYDHDKAEFSTSLGSTLIYDRLTGNIVAEYTGRPLTSNLYYENARKLIKHYNAMCLYENEKVGFFQYLDRKNETWMLLDTPRILKDIIQNTNVKRAGNKGMHMVTKLKDFGINMINNWLREPVHEDNPDYLNAHNIKSIPLLKELILFNKEINADRVSAMIILMYHLEEIKRYQFSEDSANYKTIANSDFFTKKIFARNPVIQSWK